MPINYQRPAYDYGLALLNQQQPPNQAGALGGIERAAAPILGALIAKKKQKELADAYANVLSQQGDPSQAVAQSANPDLIAALAPQLLQGRIAANEQANQPITPFQKAQLARQEQSDLDDLTRDVAATTERSIDRGDRRNESINARATAEANAQAQRDFIASQNQLNRENAVNVAATRSGSAGSNVQSVQPLGDGTLLKVYRDGSTERVDLEGKPVMGARNDPTALFNQRAAGAAGAAAGTQAEAAPVLDANFKTITDALNAFDDPNVKAQAPRAIGFGGLLPSIPGVNTDFRARAEQLGGQAFLQAYSTLRGGGQITEVEGQKATAAIARLNKAQTPTEFYKALDEAKTTFKTIYDAAKVRAGRGAVVPQLQGGAQPTSPQQPQAQQQAGPARISSDAEYDALPSGVVFVGPDGQQRRKP